jgi:23S rRNA pseudouridine1911/1915/1917 synthase
MYSDQIRCVIIHNQADFRILGESDDFLAVDKPAGLLVHPTKPGGPWTLWDGLSQLLIYEIANGGQVSLINRLDRETSGVVLVAKSALAARAAGLAMQGGEFAKEYEAVVFGWPEWDELTVDAPILRRGEVEDSPIYLERAVHPAGAPAQTHFRVRERLERKEDHARLSVLQARPITGRTHQIRVHAAHVGVPVVGDKIYARGSHCYLEFIQTGWTSELAKELWLPRHALHCARMAWPERGLAWASERPADLAAFLTDSCLAARR